MTSYSLGEQRGDHSLNGLRSQMGCLLCSVKYARSSSHRLTRGSETGYCRLRDVQRREFGG